MKKIMVALVLCMSFMSQAYALPEKLKADYPDLEKVGESSYYFFFVHVYNISLYQIKNAPELEALNIEYSRDLTAKRRLEKAMEDLEAQGKYSKEKLKEWEKQMAIIFPNVKEGDTITIFKNESLNTEFYHNNNYRGFIDDPEFTEAFMGIWLSEKPANVKMKNELIKDAFHH